MIPSLSTQKIWINIGWLIFGGNFLLSVESSSFYKGISVISSCLVATGLVLARFFFFFFLFFFVSCCLGTRASSFFSSFSLFASYSSTCLAMASLLVQTSSIIGSNVCSSSFASYTSTCLAMASSLVYTSSIFGSNVYSSSF